MNNLIVNKNGNVLRKHNAMTGFPAWTSFIDELFGEEFANVKTSNFNKGISTPKVNIKESEEAYTLDMAVPGFNKSDFVIDIEDETLSISMEVTKEDEKTEENYSRKEYGYASFKRSFSLPETVEQEKIEATYKDGILSVSIPKKEEAKPKPARKIVVG
ncbi:Hsp20/alpha crystallin family protein [Lutimonas zeaxanthinifaciens]|uniref:Hsp20/alpha crystallin family protein n=1 Tax=Lutimonas zeaxanthinifaciens TaxID=3060215 RepID=UPI00265CE0C8|nr:Hsp20/alpha crystallin family protein [Lutimonas sp. YSD2104]WKK64598.1 Hsp20/alpha crystallin family protein [Lutimonas sp. YSD2104]